MPGWLPPPNIFYFVCFFEGIFSAPIIEPHIEKTLDCNGSLRETGKPGREFEVVGQGPRFNKRSGRVNDAGLALGVASRQIVWLFLEGTSKNCPTPCTAVS